MLQNGKECVTTVLATAEWLDGRVNFSVGEAVLQHGVDSCVVNAVKWRGMGHASDHLVMEASVVSRVWKDTWNW